MPITLYDADVDMSECDVDVMREQTIVAVLGSFWNTTKHMGIPTLLC